MNFTEYVIVREEMLKYGLDNAALALDINNRKLYAKGKAHNKSYPTITIPTNWEQRLFKFKQDKLKQKKIRRAIEKDGHREAVQGTCHLKGFDLGVTLRAAFILPPLKLAWRS